MNYKSGHCTEGKQLHPIPEYFLDTLNRSDKQVGPLQGSKRLYHIPEYIFVNGTLNRSELLVGPLQGSKRLYHVPEYIFLNDTLNRNE